jgi:hypothetical protein
LQTNILALLVEQGLLVMLVPIAFSIALGIIVLNSRRMRGQASRRKNAKIVHYRRRSTGDWRYFGFGFSNVEGPR